MRVSIYIDKVYREFRDLDDLPSIGDEIEMLEAGKPAVFRVEAVYRYFGIDNTASYRVAVAHWSPLYGG